MDDRRETFRQQPSCEPVNLNLDDRASSDRTGELFLRVREFVAALTTVREFVLAVLLPARLLVLPRARAHVT
jgi:hypothetical protein